MEKRSALSFGFSKKVEQKKLEKSSFGEKTETDTQDKDLIVSVEDKLVKGSKPEKKAKEYVIPLIKQNNWRQSDGQHGDIEDQAVREIIQDTEKQREEWDNQGKIDPNVSIPLLMKNKVPEGFETDDKLDVSLRPNEPEEADYEEIPIEQYGFAMLRGMGWKDGEGIGKNKQHIAPMQPNLRPKGMGLGADRSQLTQSNYTNKEKSGDNEEADLEIKKGAYCVMIKGPNQDLYGQIQGLDEDNARIIVKLTISGKLVTQSQYNMKLVTEKEYNKYSKYLNKGKADDYKKKEEKRSKHHKSSRRSESPEHKSSSKEKSRHHKSHRHRESPVDRSPDRDKREDEKRERGERRLHESHDDRKSQKQEYNEKNSRKRKYDDREDNSSKSSVNGAGNTKSYLWVRPQILVRIIDKHFKKGKYYKAKVIVLDVISPENCVCKTDDGKVLEGLAQSSLETVIPKSDPAFVLIVHGKYKGQLAEVISRNKKSCQADLQLLRDRDHLITVDYDHICEYAGDINEEFDY